MCFSVTSPVERISINPAILQSLIYDQRWAIPMGMLDSLYWYSTPEGWAEVLRSILLSDIYRAEVYDCEDYALEAMVLVSKKFGLNAFGMAIGNSSQGKHAFNVFYMENGWWVYEPQTKSGLGYFPLGENGYIPELILI